jgi:tight adherence protein C
MTTPLIGGLLGLLTAVGVLVAVAWSPPVRRVRLRERIAPYLVDAPRPSRLLAESAGGNPLGALGRLLKPVLADAARGVERTLGGARSIRRRLAALGSRQTVEEFRVEQVIWGAAGLAGGVVAGLVLAAARDVAGVVAVALVGLTGLAAGVLGRDWWLSAQVRRREQAMLAEFPVIAELLALAVAAGEAPSAALERVCGLSGGELARELETVLTEARTGVPLPAALHTLSERTSLEPLARFVDGVIIALERGTPLADVLRAQAMDVREAGKRALLAAGGRRELAMMVPVVFLILPVTVLFALYPGLVNLTMLTR